MDAISEFLNRSVEQLLGRASGPLHFRLILQPIVATTLAIRAGIRDAREGQPAFLWTVLTDSAGRRRMVQSGWKDIGKIFILATALDTVYQIVVLRAFYPGQTLIVAVVVALLPYALLRGPATRLTRVFHRLQAQPAKVSAHDPNAGR